MFYFPAFCDFTVKFFFFVSKCGIFFDCDAEHNTLRLDKISVMRAVWQALWIAVCQYLTLLCDRCGALSSMRKEHSTVAHAILLKMKDCKNKNRNSEFC